MFQSERQSSPLDHFTLPTVSIDLDKTLPRRTQDVRSTVSSLDPREDPLLWLLPSQNGLKRMGSCALYSVLGRGSMGAVYLARDLELGIDVAVKCLLPDRMASRSSSVARFEREGQVGKTLDHPNVVQVLRRGASSGLRYLVMEYVHGETLRQRVARRGPSTLAEAIGIAKRAAQGLAAAHDRGLIHRDIKPGNLMLGTSGEVKVCDLGLAKGLACDGQLTQKHSVLGSPRYMAPEQWLGSCSVGPAADVYGLGATLFFLLTGKDGNQGVRLDEIREVTVERGLPSLGQVERNLPARLIQVVDRCVDRDARRRYSDCRALVRDLEFLAARFGSELLEAGRETSCALAQSRKSVPIELASAHIDASGERKR